MKFAALALTLLLAVGSQAATMQADAPSNIEHYLASFKTVIGIVKRSLAPLDGTEHSYVKDAVVQALDYADDFITSKQAEIIAYIQSAKEVASDTFGFDGERLRQEMTPLVNNLRIGEHIDQYNEKLGVILTIITADYRLATDSIIPKIVPQLEELRRLFQVNSMDTKEKLMPILEVIKRELTAVYSKLKEILGPYITEYKEQVTGVHQHLKSLSPERKEEIEKILQGIFVQFQSIIEIIYGRAN